MDPENHETLHGQSNYTRSKGELIVYAETEGVLKLVKDPDGGTVETVLQHPGDPPDISATTSDGTTTGGLSFSDQLTAYEFKMKLYDKQQDRIRKCKKLLVKLVHPSIQDQISSMPPAETWNYLESHYKM